MGNQALWMVAQVKSKAEKLGVHINWMGRRDHLDPVLQDYQVSQGFRSLAGVWVPAGPLPSPTYWHGFLPCMHIPTNRLGYDSRTATSVPACLQSAHD